MLLGTTAGLTLALLPGTATADPEQAATAAQASALAAEAGHRLEVVTEQVNEAREVLAQQQAAAEQADRAAADARSQLDALDGRLREVARSAYTAGDSMAELDLLMTSDSAEDFVSSLAILDRIAGHTTDVLAEVGEAAAAAHRAQADAEQAETAAQRSLDDLSAQEDRLRDDVADYQEQVAALTAAEQEAAAAAQRALAAQQAGSVGQSAPAGAGPAAAPAPAASAPAPAPAGGGSGAAQTAVQTALAQVGDAYVWGAGGPDAFDCSGLTQYAYAAAGISLPHSSRMQSQMGTAVSRAELQPGDLIFYYSPVSHVAMYIGNGQMVHASTSTQPVKVVSVDSMGGITGMRRIA
ncbi:cell wall-associated NlpC family hydrolase [Geodermatophilus tzadiensis]|uniref:Cell wall-associated NlpC family hydrolase n=1 Tax=Geodermatophilus tzadiensis TaxID=1137988 RepID=A0A2T0TXQ9_9ACTN|nr:C40 family peptidase [Geodermatophilus tzadiensis]PRY50475.1 cell wall-associated NlpC family hydrolase [Geodermatophilus tzadiensis]